MAAPDRLTLLIGPDEATAAARGRALVEAAGPEAERVELSAAEVARDPLILATEAASASLFADRRILRVSVTGPGEEVAEAAKRLLEAPKTIHPVVIVAPGATEKGRLAKACAAHRAARIIRCPVPGPDELARLAVSLAAAEHCQLGNAEARRLVELVEQDQGLLRQEIVKLALYLDAGPGRERRIDAAAIAAIGAQLFEEDVDRLIDAVLLGDLPALPAELARLKETGVNPITFLRALGRRVALLMRLHAGTGRVWGIPPGGDARVRRQARLWPVAPLMRLNQRILTAERDQKRSGTPGVVLLDQFLLQTAQRAAQVAARQR